MINFFIPVYKDQLIKLLSIQWSRKELVKKTKKELLAMYIKWRLKKG